jgi:hypothetical protein
MAKKTVAKAAAKKPAAKTKPAPPPAKRPDKKGAPAGGELVWEQHGRGGGGTVWLAPDPEGDRSKAGARIKMTTQGWLGKANDPLYYVYRDGEYLGSDPTLASAQRRALYRERSASRLKDTIPGGGMPAFLNLSAAERKAQRGEEPTPARRVHALPSPVEKAGAAPQDGEAERAQRVRSELAAQKPPKAPRGSKKGEGIDEAGIITMLTNENPRKPGTGAYTRFEQLRSFAGKTVRDYKAAGGNMETLDNAIAAKRAQVSGE